MPTTMPAEGRRGCQQTRRTRSKNRAGRRRRANPQPFLDISKHHRGDSHLINEWTKTAPEGLPGKRPAPVVPRPRTIGCVVGSDSYRSNEQIWQDFVDAGLIPEDPRCPICNGPLPTETARRDLHFSLRCRP